MVFACHGTECRQPHKYCQLHAPDSRTKTEWLTWQGSTTVQLEEPHSALLQVPPRAMQFPLHPQAWGKHNAAVEATRRPLCINQVHCAQTVQVTCCSSAFLFSEHCAPCGLCRHGQLILQSLLPPGPYLVPRGSAPGRRLPNRYTHILAHSPAPFPSHLHIAKVNDADIRWIINTLWGLNRLQRTESAGTNTTQETET